MQLLPLTDRRPRRDWEEVQPRDPTTALPLPPRDWWGPRPRRRSVQANYPDGHPAFRRGGLRGVGPPGRLQRFVAGFFRRVSFLEADPGTEGDQERPFSRAH